jgi:hypothetical protein
VAVGKRLAVVVGVDDVATRRQLDAVVPRAVGVRDHDDGLVPSEDADLAVVARARWIAHLLGRATGARDDRPVDAGAGRRRVVLRPKREGEAHREQHAARSDHREQQSVSE